MQSATTSTQIKDRFVVNAVWLVEPRFGQIKQYPFDIDLSWKFKTSKEYGSELSETF